MPMALVGTPDREREYIFTTPVEAGLSYKLVSLNDPLLRNKVAQCYPFFEKSILRSKSEDIYNAADLYHRVLSGTSDLWVSTDENNVIQGCFVIGFGEYPQSRGICAEAISGVFDFTVVTPVVEEYYKKLGYEFFEMTGRKGWEKVMEPMGYEFKNITIRKRL